MPITPEQALEQSKARVRENRKRWFERLDALLSHGNRRIFLCDLQDWPRERSAQEAAVIIEQYRASGWRVELLSDYEGDPYESLVFSVPCPG